MNKYESIIIINSNVEEQARKALIEKISALINKDGKVESVEEIGNKKLAYEINKNSEGYYVVINFEANPVIIAEVERNYRIMDEILKFIIIKK